jgi:hypothetical protein
MKNNIELFTRYFENDLGDLERESFDNKLLEEPNFNEEFLKFIELYNSSKSSFDVDDRYFSTIIPNARKRLENPKPNYLTKSAYLLPIVIIALFFIINSPSSSIVSFKYDFENLLVSFTETEELTEDLFFNAFNIESSYILEDELISEYYENDIKLDESVFEYLEQNLGANEVNYNLINQLSDNEFNNLYDELIDKKIL